MEAARVLLLNGGELRLCIHTGGRTNFEPVGGGRAFRTSSVFKLVRVRAAATVSRETACGRFTDVIIRGV